MTGGKPRTGPEQLACLLAHAGTDAVIDVGANAGQYGRFLRAAGWRGPLLSFEPLAGPHAALASAAAGDPAWHVAPRLALGDRAGELTLEVSAESDMSSVLPQTDLLRAVSPSSAIVARETVPARRLDALAELVDPAWRRLHLKIDVQGYKPEVLEGASGLLPRIASLQLELALEPVYAGETGWRQMVDRIAGLGFGLALVLPGYFERKLGRMLQFDGVFLRSSAGGAGAGSLNDPEASL